MKNIFVGVQNGWILEDAPETYIPAYVDFTMAHDILEHMRGDNGTLEDEFKALGRMLFVRAEGDYWRRFVEGYRHSIHAPQFLLGGDFSGLFEHGFDVEEFPDQPRSNAFVEHVLDSLEHVLFTQRNWMWPYEMTLEDRHSYFHLVKQYMRWGYNHARTVRYRQHSAKSMAEYFHEICQTVNPFVGDVSFTRKLVVQTNFTKLTVDAYTVPAY